MCSFTLLTVARDCVDHWAPAMSGVHMPSRTQRSAWRQSCATRALGLQSCSQPAYQVLCLLPVTPLPCSVVLFHTNKGVYQDDIRDPSCRKLCLLKFSAVVQSLTNVFSTFLLSIYYSQGLFHPGSSEVTVNKTDKDPCPHEACVLSGEPGN